MSEHDTKPAAAQPAGNDSIIESASATTGPDNHAGALPYVIVVATLLVVILLAQGIVSSVASIAFSSLFSGNYDNSGLNSLLEDLGGSGGNGSGNGLGGLGNGSNGSGSGTGSDGLGGRQDPRRGTALTSDNVFDFDLTFLDSSVEDYVYATDYQGAQTSVSTFVKTLAKADSDAVGTVQSHVRAAAAATDDATRASELDQASKACADAKNAVLSLGVDTISGSQASSINDDLMDARSEAASRWDSAAKVIAILASPDGHTESELSKLNDDADEASDIAEELVGALYDSAEYK